MKRSEGNLILRWPPLPVRSPPTLPDIDCRFCPEKVHRVFVCDECGDVVRFSKGTKLTGSKAECEFAGNYEDGSWTELDYSLRWEAWNMGLIDARWLCQRVCGQNPTGACVAILFSVCCVVVLLRFPCPARNWQELLLMSQCCQLLQLNN